MGIERREIEGRAQVVRSVVDHVVRTADTTVTVQSLQDYLQVPANAAARILSNLVAAGIVKEVRQGVWSRVAKFPSASR